MTTSTSRPRRRSSEVFATTAQLSQNFLALMASGAVIAMAGLLSGPVPQSLALAAAGIIAPAFEPVAKLAVGLVRGNWYVSHSAGAHAVSGDYMALAVVGRVGRFTAAGAGHGEPEALAVSDGVVTHPPRSRRGDSH
jgi:hypothetical protein